MILNCLRPPRDMFGCLPFALDVATDSLKVVNFAIYTAFGLDLCGSMVRSVSTIAIAKRTRVFGIS